MFSSTGEVAFEATLNTPYSPNGLWMSDPSGNLFLIAVADEPISIDGKDLIVRQVTYASLSDAGLLSYVLYLSDGSYATFTATVPEPSCAALLFPAASLMFLIRRRSK
jgi:hypothetical protein